MARTIMIVDDDLEVRQLVQKLLAPLADTVVTAHDGEAALWQMDKVTPDLMIVDLSMPRVKGWDLIDELRRNEAWARIPIMVLTGMGGFVERTIMKPLAHVDAYVTKPFKPEELRDKVSKLLDRETATKV